MDQKKTKRAALITDSTEGSDSSPLLPSTPCCWNLTFLDSFSYPNSLNLLNNWSLVPSSSSYCLSLSFPGMFLLKLVISSFFLNAFITCLILWPLGLPNFASLCLNYLFLSCIFFSLFSFPFLFCL